MHWRQTSPEADAAARVVDRSRFEQARVREFSAILLVEEEPASVHAILDRAGIGSVGPMTSGRPELVSASHHMHPSRQVEQADPHGRVESRRAFEPFPARRPMTGGRDTLTASEGAEMHNPLRSEAEVFRAVIVIGSARRRHRADAARQPTAGGLLLLVLVLAGLWSSGGAPRARCLAGPRWPPRGRRPPDPRRRQRDGRRPSPARRDREALQGPPQRRSWSSAGADRLAAPALGLRHRRGHWRRAGAPRRVLERHARPRHHSERPGGRPPRAQHLARGRLRAFAADEVIISTHPPERSRWLERGVVAKRRETVLCRSRTWCRPRGRGGARPPAGDPQRWLVPLPAFRGGT